MWRRLLHWLTPFLVTGLLLVPALASAQPQDKKASVQDLRWKDESGSTPQIPSTSATGRIPVLEYTLALLGSALVLAVACTPSRKR